MGSVKKLEQELESMKKPENLFIFEINEDDDVHVRLCKFIAYKSRKIIRKVDGEDVKFKTWTNSEKVARLTGAELLPNVAQVKKGDE